MKVNRAHKIRLYPNNVQKTYFKKACGTSRFVYNWGLSLWKVQYELGKKPSAFGLKKEFNTIKNKNFPWISEVTKCASEQAFNNLGTSFKNFFTKKSKYPSYKKKGNRDSFYISNDKFLIKGDKIRIPKLGFVRMREELRFVGKIMSVTVSRVADQWYVAISVETEVTSSVFENQEAVGVDLGVKALATLSTGEVVIGPKPHKQLLARLRLLNKSVARKKKGSSNRRKAVLNLSKLHSRIACIRNDTIHKLTTRLSQDFAIIGIEDLNVRGYVQKPLPFKSYS